VIFIPLGLAAWVFAFLFAIKFLGQTAKDFVLVLLSALSVIWIYQSVSLIQLNECNMSISGWLKSVLLLSPECPIHYGNTEPLHALGFFIRKLSALAFLIIAALRAVLILRRDRHIQI
jgi:hypothetical protein